MVKRTGRSFTTYDAQKMVEELEPTLKAIGEWNAKVPLGEPIYVALLAWHHISRLLLDTARGDIHKPIGQAGVAPHGHSSPPGMTPREWP